MITPATTTVYIGIGANLGDTRSTITKAIAMIGAIPQSRLLASALIRSTAPVDCPVGSSDFLNTVVALETSLEPRALLNALLSIERTLGRIRTAARNEPRLIDLDLLLYGNSIITDSNITVPHPRMHLREFVLAPLAEIAPQVIHPVNGKSASLLLAELHKATVVAAT